MFVHSFVFALCVLSNAVLGKVNNSPPSGALVVGSGGKYSTVSSRLCQDVESMLKFKGLKSSSCRQIGSNNFHPGWYEALTHVPIHSPLTLHRNLQRTSLHPIRLAKSCHYGRYFRYDLLPQQ
jgi:hypothetical protein